MFSRETAGDQQRLALNARRAPFWLRKEVHLGPPARTKNATTLPITHASNPVLVGLGSVVAESRTMNAQTNPIRDVRIRVVVADDHPVIRRMVRSTLQQHPLEVCGEVFYCGSQEGGCASLCPEVKDRPSLRRRFRSCIKRGRFYRPRVGRAAHWRMAAVACFSVTKTCTGVMRR